jgi:hypothetical protein
MSECDNTSVIYSLKKACDSVKIEVLYKTCTELLFPMKLVGLIKECLSETYSKDCL